MPVTPRNLFEQVIFSKVLEDSCLNMPWRNLLIDSIWIYKIKYWIKIAIKMLKKDNDQMEAFLVNFSNFLKLYIILPFRGFSMYQWLWNFSWRTVTSWLLNEWSWVSVKDSCGRILSKFIKKSAALLISTFMMTMYALSCLCSFNVERIKKILYSLIFTELNLSVCIYFFFCTFYFFLPKNLNRKKDFWCTSFNNR